MIIDSTKAPMTQNQCYNQPFFDWNGIIDYSTEYKQYNKADFGSDNLINDDLINLCKNKKHIIIYGHSKTGKVFLAKKISEKIGCKLIISDDYMNLGWSDNMYYIRDLLKNELLETQTIFEGVQTCRLLRKGVQFNDYYPDLIIHITCNYESIVQSYYNDRQQYKLKGGKVKRFNEKILDKIFFEWYDILIRNYPNKKPIIININTSYVSF